MAYNTTRHFDIIDDPRTPTPSPPPSRRLLRRRDIDGKILGRPRVLGDSDLKYGRDPLRSPFTESAGSKNYTRSSSESSESSDSSQSSTYVRPPYSAYSSSDDESTSPQEDSDEEAEVAHFLQQPSSPIYSDISHFSPGTSFVPTSFGNLLLHRVMDKFSLLPPPKPVQYTSRPSHMPRVRPEMPLNQYGNPLYPSFLKPYLIEEDDAEYRIAARGNMPEHRIPLSRNHFDHCLARHTTNMLRIYRVPIDRACKFKLICAKYGLVAERVYKPNKAADSSVTLWMQGYQTRVEQLEDNGEKDDWWMLVSGRSRRTEFEAVIARQNDERRARQRCA
ncbi:hypothetical protein CVT24_005805 [Panaeolus cyanescens]|uniref:Uncharacterized protein n=1 Tax=Panaeolus cyanescens TaxID=181874 RepID=A0A409V946_9AGAR|nr:hypothetical protein CVT24_005805 [Panaeolus cyanescens]